MAAHILGDRGRRLCEFMANLDHSVSSKIVKADQRNPVLETKQN